jgi:hypothetical protein
MVIIRCYRVRVIFVVFVLRCEERRVSKDLVGAIAEELEVSSEEWSGFEAMLMSDECDR